MAGHNWLRILLPEVDIKDKEEEPDICESTIRIIKSNRAISSHYRKVTDSPLRKDIMPDVHILIKPGNDAEKLDLWKALLYEIDNDFPFNPMRKPGIKVRKCTKCKGYYWNNATLDPHDLKKAALQVGMTKKGPDDVRIQVFKSSVKCGGSMEMAEVEV